MPELARVSLTKKVPHQVTANPPRKRRKKVSFSEQMGRIAGFCFLAILVAVDYQRSQKKKS